MNDLTLPQALQENERLRGLYRDSVARAHRLRLDLSIALRIESHDEALGYRPASDERILDAVRVVVGR
jgi:hypothetical protein